MMCTRVLFVMGLVLGPVGGLWGGVASVECQEDRTFVIQNDALSRTLAIGDGGLGTIEIVNKEASRVIHPTECREFGLRISQGTDREGTDIELTAADFKYVSHRVYEVAGPDRGQGLAVMLADLTHKISVEAHYELADGDFYLRKYLVIRSERLVTLERIDVELIGIADGYQPYQKREIYAQGPGQWRPGLGQPLFTRESATFWGVEFPAADNGIKRRVMACGYLWGRQIEADRPYQTYRAVMGVGDDPAYITDAFLEYIDRIRIRPLRLQTQYNSWFDTGRGVSRESFAKSVAKIHQELVEKRGGLPLKAYVIDDGWQDSGTRANWTDKVWKVNEKFDPDFARSRQAVQSAGASLGLWLSPGCNFGARSMVPKLKAAGFEALDNWMSLAGEKYMQALEDRMVELARQGVTYFKLDGLFGHLNVRDFDLQGAAHGLPGMPQLDLEGFRSDDARLNHAKYDELKIYYLTAGTERLIRLFDKVAEARPDIYMVISNGAWLSPWWLMHIDSVWMINAGDAAGGSSRTEELVYRDGVYYEIWSREHTQYPMNSIFNHEPKKTRTGEAADVFRKYLYMHLSRGTGFIEFVYQAVCAVGG